jgi:hypothetical protein
MYVKKIYIYKIEIRGQMRQMRQIIKKVCKKQRLVRLALMRQILVKCVKKICVFLFVLCVFFLFMCIFLFFFVIFS